MSQQIQVRSNAFVRIGNLLRTIGCIAILLGLSACRVSLPTISPRVPQITVIADHETSVVETSARTVKELLDEQGITLNPEDRVAPPETTLLLDGSTIRITRVVYATEILTTTLPFERQIVRDATVQEGQTQLLQTGSEGVLERQYTITYEDGIEVSRVLAREATVLEAVDEILLQGTRPKLESIEIAGKLAYLNNHDAWFVTGNNLTRRRLTRTADLDERVFELSPDGDLLLFTRSVSETVDGFNTLWVVRTQQAQPNPVPLSIRNVVWAGWSPDGNQIAWSTAEALDEAPGWRGENDLWIAALSSSLSLGRQSVLIEASPGGGYGWWGTHFTWSPSGDLLVAAQPDRIYLYALKDIDKYDIKKGITEVTSFPAFRTFSNWTWHPGISWSPDGAFFTAAYHNANSNISNPEESPVFDLRIYSVTGTYSTTLAIETGMWTAPEYAPDQSKILYGQAVIPYQSATSAYRLCRMDVDGSNKLCFYPSIDQSALDVPEWHWGPESTLIAFVQQGNVYVLDVNTLAAVPITDDGGVSKLDWR